MTTTENKPTKRVPKSKTEQTVSFTVSKIPPEVYDKIKRYRRLINSERDADYNINDAFVEFLKEKTAEDTRL
jgi:hypothetical protein